MTLIGQDIGKIRITRKIGEGGMGEVYVGFDEVLEREVAVKALHEDLLQNENARNRFLREAKVLSRIEHPNICRIYDFVVMDNRIFLILELIQGKSLRNLIRTSMPMEKKRHIARQILRALITAHEKNIIHRDLKPDNIMVSDQGVVKVLDFGLARFALDPSDDTARDQSDSLHRLSDSLQNSAELALTRHSMIMGTPRYMSPEQAKGEDLSTSCDLYALGLILQELFTGKSPIDEELSVPALLFQTMQGNTMPVEGLDKDLTSLLTELKSLAPGMRPNAPTTLQRLEVIWDKPRLIRKRVTYALISLVLLVSTLISSVGFYQARQSERDAIASKEKTEAINEFLESMLSSVNPFEKGNKDVKVVEILEHASEKAENAFKQFPERQAMIFSTLGTTYRRLGDFNKAEHLLHRAYEIRQKRLGPEQPETLFTRNDLGMLYFDQGKNDLAVETLQDTLDICKKTLKPNAALTLSVKGNLALVLDRAGKYAEAETLNRDVLEHYKKGQEKDQARYLMTLSNLALSLDHQGKYQEALPLFRTAFEEGKRMEGPEHPNTITYANNLASVFEELGQFEKAEHIHRQNIPVIGKVLGEEHPYFFSAKNNLALALYRQGKIEECEKVFRDVYVRGRSVLGESHPRTLIWMSNLGRLLLKEKKYGEAKPILLENMKIRLKSLGKNHPDTADSQESLGELFFAEQEYTLAGKYFLKAYRTREQTFGAENRATVLLAFRLGKTELELGHRHEARIWLEKALKNGSKTANSGNATIKEIKQLLTDLDGA